MPTNTGRQKLAASDRAAEVTAVAAGGMVFAVGALTLGVTSIAAAAALPAVGAVIGGFVGRAILSRLHGGIRDLAE